jgi:hypothetical protein
MIFSLFVWVILFCVISLFGLAVVKMIIKLFKLSDSFSTHMPVLWLMGWIAVSVYGMTMSLWFPLRGFTFFLLIFGSIILAWFFRHTIKTWLKIPKLHPFTWILAILMIMLVLQASAHSPSNPDSGIYHAQNIRWIETYPAVVGLGNLHTRFAYNSSWLVVNALFSLAFINSQSFHLLPELLFLIASMYLITGIDHILQRKHTLSDFIKLALLPLAVYMFLGEVSSPGTDLPAYIITWMVILLWLDSIEKPDQSAGYQTMSVLLAVFALTIKLSTLPLLIVALIWCINIIRSGRMVKFVPMFFLCLAILMPWVVRNVILSGYVVFPQTLIDPLDVDWKIPSAVVKDEVRAIQSWARIPREKTDIVLNMHFTKWVKIWFLNLSAGQKLSVVLALFSPISVLLLVVTGIIKRDRVISYSLLFLVAYSGFVYWFFTAPAIRFGYGIIAINLALCLMPWAHWLFTKFDRWHWLGWAAGLILSLFLITVFVQSLDKKSFFSSVLMPSNYRSLPTSPCKFGNFEILCADSYQECWYDPFPCVPAGNPDVYQRGESYSDGFRYGP